MLSSNKDANTWNGIIDLGEKGRKYKKASKHITIVKRPFCTRIM